MPATRTRKRAADDIVAADDSSAPAAKKQASGNASNATQNDDDSTSATTNRRSGRAKATANASTPTQPATDAAPVKDVKKGRGKAKTSSQPNNDEDGDDAVDGDQDTKTKKAAPSQANGTKSKGTKSKANKKDSSANDDATQAETVAAADSAQKDTKTEPLSLSEINVPVDEYCSLTTHKVFIDSDNGIIYDAALNQTNAGNNNNKFYKIQILTDGKNDFRTWTRWGRVGENGQNALLGNGTFDDALKNYDKKFKDKTGLKWDDRTGNPKSGKYVYVERNYEPDSDSEDAEKDSGDVKEEETEDSKAEKPPPVECTLSAPVKSLMELIFNQDHMQSAMADLNYDAKKLPLGKLSKGTVSRGYEALKSLSEIIDDPNLAGSSGDGETYTQAINRLSNLYYSLIPHAFGRNRPPVISDTARLRKEIELLDSLTDMKLADSLLKAEKTNAEAVHILDTRFKGLGLDEMLALDHQSDEFTKISEYLTGSRGATHGHSYDVLDVFRIERKGEARRFKELDTAKAKSDRRLLWHGSRSTNFGGILSQGLRIAPPEAPVNGYMFGKGLYLADMSSKSANYCCSYSSGGHALLLLCEAELGDPMLKLTNASYSAGSDAAKQGSLTTWGQGSTGPLAWKDAGCIHSDLAGIKMPDTSVEPGDTKVNGASLFYNEYICYDVAQVRLRYLLRVKM